MREEIRNGKPITSNEQLGMNKDGKTVKLQF